MTTLVKTLENPAEIGWLGQLALEQELVTKHWDYIQNNSLLLYHKNILILLRTIQ
jgi:hypothetical protein